MPAPTAQAVQPAPAVRPRPRLWLRMSIARGNAVQGIGTALGAAAIAGAAVAGAPAAARFALLLIGWLVIYDCTHAVGHYLAGRLVGIRFRFYGVRGTDHPEDYPPGIRQVMAVAPFWTVVTDKPSMRTAAPWRQAVMFAAGETATAVCSIAAAGIAAAAGVPGATGLLWFSVVWNAVSTVVTAITPKGDYAKARRALRRAI